MAGPLDTVLGAVTSVLLGSAGGQVGRAFLDNTWNNTCSWGGTAFLDSA